VCGGGQKNKTRSIQIANIFEESKSKAGYQKHFFHASIQEAARVADRRTLTGYSKDKQEQQATLTAHLLTVIYWSENVFMI